MQENTPESQSNQKINSKGVEELLDYIIYSMDDNLSRTETLSKKNLKNLQKIDEDIKHLKELLIDEEADTKFHLGNEDIMFFEHMFF